MRATHSLPCLNVDATQQELHFCGPYFQNTKNFFMIETALDSSKNLATRGRALSFTKVVDVESLNQKDFYHSSHSVSSTLPIDLANAHCHYDPCRYEHSHNYIFQPIFEPPMGFCQDSRSHQTRHRTTPLRSQSMDFISKQTKNEVDIQELKQDIGQIKRNIDDAFRFWSQISGSNDPNIVTRAALNKMLCMETNNSQNNTMKSDSITDICQPYSCSPCQNFMKTSGSCFDQHVHCGCGKRQFGLAPIPIVNRKFYNKIKPRPIQRCCSFNNMATISTQVSRRNSLDESPNNAPGLKGPIVSEAETMFCSSSEIHVIDGTNNSERIIVPTTIKSVAKSDHKVISAKPPIYSPPPIRIANSTYMNNGLNKSKEINFKLESKYTFKEISEVANLLESEISTNLTYLQDFLRNPNNNLNEERATEFRILVVRALRLLDEEISQLLSLIDKGERNCHRESDILDLQRFWALNMGRVLEYRNAILDVMGDHDLNHVILHHPRLNS